MLKHFSLLIISVLLLTACKGGGGQNRIDADGSLHGRISLSGAFAVYPLAVKWAAEFQKLHPDVRVEVDAGGAGKGMTDALTGQVELGMISRDVSEAEKQKGAVAYTVAMDAVVPTINDKNPFIPAILKHGVTAADVKAIWGTGTMKTWGQLLGTAETQQLAVFTRSDACGAAETWAKWMELHQEDLHGEGVNGDPGMATAIAKNKYAIGMNNLGYAYDSKTQKPISGIRVIPVDLNANGMIDPDEQFYDNAADLAKAIADGRYPAPPARYLYFVSKGQPTDPVLKAFLKYVLSDEAQRLNAEAGYIKAPSK